MMLNQEADAKIEHQLLDIHQSHRVTFFCEQAFSPTGHTLKEQTKIKWMPLVSSKEFAKDFLCYAEKICINNKGERFKGLRCCQQSDPIFQQMQKDLHNFVPEVTLLKQQRSSFRFGLCQEHSEITAGCQIRIDKKNKIIEPDASLRGIIARGYLYMAHNYPMRLSEAEKALYLAWHQAYAPTAWEKERNLKIKAIQGNGNPYVY